MPDRQSPKTALVTGANRGIGFEIARQLASHGIRVLAGVRSAEKAAEAGAEFSKAGVSVTPVVLDVADAARVPEALAEHRAATWRDRCAREQCGHPDRRPGRV